MNRLLLLTLLGIGLSLGGVGCAAQQNAASHGAKSTVLLNVISGREDPHPVTMALQLAGHALDDGRNVVLFFNVKGVSIPQRSLPATLAYHDQPIKSLLSDLVDRGATVLVCPACMQAEGVSADDLIDGAETASRAKVFDPLDAHAVVFTY
jgi:predicted peroxiredoxin